LVTGRAVAEKVVPQIVDILTGAPPGS